MTSKRPAPGNGRAFFQSELYRYFFFVTFRSSPDQRVVELGYNPLLERNDRVVGDVDVLRADLGAALGDVAEAEPALLLDAAPARSFVSSGCISSAARRTKKRGPGERWLVLVVVADDVADVLAQEALDALVEFLDAVDVLLVHAVLAVGLLAAWA